MLASVCSRSQGQPVGERSLATTLHRSPKDSDSRVASGGVPGTGEGLVSGIGRSIRCQRRKIESYGTDDLQGRLLELPHAHSSLGGGAFDRNAMLPSEKKFAVSGGGPRKLLPLLPSCCVASVQGTVPCTNVKRSTGGKESKECIRSLVLASLFTDKSPFFPALRWTTFDRMCTSSGISSLISGRL